MKPTHVLIDRTRIVKSMIKKYTPVDETKIRIVYNASRFKIDQEIFDFHTKADRDLTIDIMDDIFL